MCSRSACPAVSHNRSISDAFPYECAIRAYPTSPFQKITKIFNYKNFISYRNFLFFLKNDLSETRGVHLKKVDILNSKYSMPCMIHSEQLIRGENERTHLLYIHVTAFVVSEPDVCLTTLILRS